MIWRKSQDLMSSLHLACDESMEPVDCPYSSLIMQPSCELARAPYDFRAESAATVRFLYGFTSAVSSTILFSEDL